MANLIRTALLAYFAYFALALATQETEAQQLNGRQLKGFLLAKKLAEKLAEKPPMIVVNKPDQVAQAQPQTMPVQAAQPAQPIVISKKSLFGKLFGKQKEKIIIQKTPMTPGEQGVPVPPVPTDTSTVPQTTTPVMESPVQTPPGAVSGVSEVSGVSGAGS